MLLLDQRGTGRSTPVTGRETAEYLTHFRADSIVRDAERAARGARLGAVERARPELRRAVRLHLPLARPGRPARGVRSPAACPGIGVPIDDVYRATWERMIERNRRYYARYPAGPRADARAARAARPEDVRLPNGDRLTAAAAHLGNRLGHERRLRDAALHPRAAARLARLPARRRATRSSSTRNPIYALLHEACWADGGVTNWSAQRDAPGAFAERRATSPASTSSRGCSRTTARWRRRATRRGARAARVAAAV